MKKSRVLVVDDSASMRQLISAVLNSAPDMEVVGHAADPIEARQAIKDLSPDVVTLDVEMPNMNGIDFLERLMRLRPMPVIMVSSLTQRGGEITTRALEIGAIDCVMKPSLGDARPFGDLVEKVRMASGVRMRPAHAPPDIQARPSRPRPRRPIRRMVGSWRSGVRPAASRL